MKNLLKADLFRVLRTKVFYIGLIISVLLPLFIAVVSGLTEMAVRSVDPEMEYATKIGDSLLTTTFSPLMSFSFIFAVFPVIIILMDFGNGTLRNKVIHGYTRHQIYAAHFIISLLYISVITLLFSATNIVASFILGVSEVPASVIPLFISYFLIGFLGVVMVASIGCSLGLSLNNAGAVVLTIFAILFFNYIGTILGVILQLAKVSDVENFLCFFPSYFTESLSNYMLYRVEKTIEPIQIIGAVGSVLTISGAFYALGTFVFNKKDFK